MADKYVIPAGGNWGDGNTWSLTDGGPGGAGVPGAGDQAWCTANSGNLAIVDVGAQCTSFSTYGYTGTVTISQPLDVNSGGVDLPGGTITGTADIFCAGGVTLGANVAGWTGTLICDATSGTPTISGGTAPKVAINNSGVTTFTLTGNLVCGLLTLTAGRFDASTPTVACAGFVFTNGTLTGSGAWTITGNLTYAAGTNSHSGPWTHGGTGNLAWNSATKIASYAIATGATITLTAVISYVGKLSIAATATLACGSNILSVDGPGADDFISVLGSVTATSGYVMCALAANRANALPITPSAGTALFRLRGSVAAITMTQTAPIAVASLGISSVNTTSPMTLSMQSALTATTVTLGPPSAVDRNGVLILGPYAHSIGSLARGDAANTSNALNFGSSYVTLSGTLNGLGIACTNTAGFVSGGTISNVDLTGQESLLATGTDGGGNVNVTFGASPIRGWPFAGRRIGAMRIG